MSFLSPLPRLEEAAATAIPAISGRRNNSYDMSRLRRRPVTSIRRARTSTRHSEPSMGERKCLVREFGAWLSD